MYRQSPFGQPSCLLHSIGHKGVYLIAISLFWEIRKLVNHVKWLCVSTLNKAKLIRVCIFLYLAEELYKEMIGCTPDDRRYYSAHFVELQVEFVERQPSNVKDLIRLVKYWRKTCIEDTGETRLPSSYPLELITIHCWEKAGKPESFDIRAGFKAVLQQLVEYCDINVRWYINYDKAPHKGRIKRMSKRFVLVPVWGKLQTISGGEAHRKVAVLIVVPFRGSNL